MPSSTRVVGLDVGTSALKATQARRNGPGVAVEHAATATLSPDVVTRGMLTESGAPHLTGALENMWRTAKFDTRDVVVGIGGEQVYLASAQVPQMSQADLTKAMPHLVRHDSLLKIDPSEVQIDFVVQGTVDSGGDGFTLDPTAPSASQQPQSAPELQVLLMAALKANIERVVRAVSAAGLNVVGVDLNALALLRAISIIHHQDPVVDALVDIGAGLTTTVIHRNGIPLALYTSAEVSGHAVTNAVIERAGISRWEEAEAAKRSWGGDPGVADALSRASARTVEVVRRHVHHFLNENPTVQGLSGITLTGGSALVEGLPQRMDEAFRVAITPAAYDQAFTGKGGMLDSYLDGGHSMMISAGLTTAKRVNR